MRRGILHFFALLIMLLVSLQGYAQQLNPGDACVVENGKFYFKIDRRWSTSDIREFRQTFDVDSIVVVKALSGAESFNINGVKWKVKRLNPYIVALSLVEEPQTKPLFPSTIVMVDSKELARLVTPSIDAVFGANKFSQDDIFSYNNGVAQLFLPGYLKARTVYIAGSFNGWSTMASPMHKTERGWEVSIKLLPGKYLYKYIIDGRWYEDPYNRNKEHNEYGEYNSIFFCPNYRFSLKGFSDANVVNLAGSFNGWNRNELSMRRAMGGWYLPVYLADGNYTYKFIVDNAWIIDPANSRQVPDGRGNINSMISIGDSVVFSLEGHLNAKSVILAGSFNEWNQGELHMKKLPTGWSIAYVLGAGNYEYKFIVDGSWIVDPNNPYMVGGGNVVNSFVAIKPNHTFVLKGYPNARRVIVTGDFNEWRTDQYVMVKKNGEWVFPLYIKPGKHYYKFIVDGVWMIDPANELYESNGGDSNNSILWIEP